MTEPQAQTLDELIRDRSRRDADDEDRLCPLRERIAAEEGIAAFADGLHGGSETQIREDALRFRRELGLPNSSPTFESALAAQRRAQAARNARMNH